MEQGHLIFGRVENTDNETIARGVAALFGIPRRLEGYPVSDRFEKHNDSQKISIFCS